MLDATLCKGTSPAPWVVGRARLRLDELGADSAALGPRESLGRVQDLLAAHQLDYDTTGIPLYAGTNVLSPTVRALHDPQLSLRPSMGWPGEKYQSGMAHVEALEVLTSRLVAQTMGAAHAEVRLHSATMANLAVYTALARPGDTIAVLSDQAGGHTSHQAIGVAGVRGLTVAHLPYDVAAWDVDVTALDSWLARVRPRIVVVGASLMLFPHRLPLLRELCEAAGAVLVYDASHVAGIVAGGRFQQPLAEGAHLMTFSTYKSFGGPAGGAIVTNDEQLAEQVANATYPGLTANYDAGRLAPLAARCVEHLEAGPHYADACLANAAALATVLADHGLEVAAPDRGWTRSHHVAVDVSSLGGGAVVSERLAEAGIWSSAIGLPRQAPDEIPAALRLGSQELTSRGYNTSSMTEIGELVADVVLGRRDPRTARAAALALRCVD